MTGKFGTVHGLSERYVPLQYFISPLDSFFLSYFKVEMSRLQPSKHEKETLEKLSDSTTELKPRRKRKRPGGPNPLSVLKSKRKKDDKHSASDDTKVESCLDFFCFLFFCLFCLYVGCSWRVYIKGYKTNGSSKSSGRIVTTRVRDGVDGKAGRLQEDTWYSRTDQYLHYAIS